MGNKSCCSSYSDYCEKEIFFSINVSFNQNNYRNTDKISIDDYDLNYSYSNDDEIVESEKNSEINSRILENVDNLCPEKKRCTICLENFLKFDKIINLSCLHMFHDKCIRKWLNDNNYCPICKNKI